MDYVIFDNHVLNQITKFELLSRYKPKADDKHLS